MDTPATGEHAASHDMAITDWPEDERPREKLLARGPDVLSDAELLAIFLRVGVKGKSAVELARDLLARFDDDLSRLAHGAANQPDGQDHEAPTPLLPAAT